MNYLILVRHGQSTWNLEKRFTGWVDVHLTEKGISEAKKAGDLIKEKNITINLYYSSLQLRANDTLKIIQKILNDQNNFVRAWELNERHYGALTGLNKIEMAKNYSMYKASVLMKQISVETYSKLQENMFLMPGFFVQTRTLRKYPYSTASHLLGYVGEVNERLLKN